MYDGFKERAHTTRTIMEADDTQFVIVSSPEARASAGAASFRDRLVERGCNVGGVVLNRATLDPFDGAEPNPGALIEALPSDPELVRRLVHVAETARRTAERHRRIALALDPKVGGVPVALIPELPRDIHDLVGLEALRSHLFRG
jgi:anion-transporting  ArsA/GET3 family ATPase